MKKSATRPQHGGARPGAGRPEKPADELTRRVTFTAPAAALAEVADVVAPESTSRYISDLLEADLQRRRRERFGRVKVSTVTGRTVLITVDIDDCEVWRRTGWKTKKVDDTRNTATLTQVYDNKAAAESVHATIAAGGPV